MPFERMRNWLGFGRRELITLAADEIPWDILPLSERVVAVGDVHGDLVALASILLERGLIDPEGRWIGGSTHLVLIGDLVGGAGESRLLVDFILRLEEDSGRDAGAVHALLGNHDVLALGRRRWKNAEKLLFKFFPVFGARSKSYAEAYRGNTRYARWLRCRNAIVRHGNTLFVHAGLDTWAMQHDPGRINATIRAWIRYFQGVDKTKPDPRSRWTVGKERMRRGSPLEIGPLWTRVFKPKLDENDPSFGRRRQRAPKRDQFREILEKYKAERMVIGHAPVKGEKVLLSHPYYGEMVVMIDTRISAATGRLSSVELRHGAITAHYAERSEMATRIRDAEFARLEGAAANGASAGLDAA